MKKSEHDGPLNISDVSPVQARSTSVLCTKSSVLGRLGPAPSRTKFPGVGTKFLRPILSRPTVATAAHQINRGKSVIIVSSYGLAGWHARVGHCEILEERAHQ